MEINEQKLEKILTDQRNEYQRYLGVLNESFESQVKLVAESTSGIQQQLVSIRDMVAKNTVDIEEIKMELHIVRGDVKSKVSRDEYNLPEQRISRIEKVISHK